MSRNAAKASQDARKKAPPAAVLAQQLVQNAREKAKQRIIEDVRSAPVPERYTMTSSGNTQWEGRFPDHDPDYLSGKITLREAELRIAARKQVQAVERSPSVSHPCLFCRGAGVRASAPVWAMDNCEPCPACQGPDPHCRTCQGSGKTGGTRMAVRAVPCDVCKGSGQDPDVQWRNDDGRPRQRTLTTYQEQALAAHEQWVRDQQAEMARDQAEVAWGEGAAGPAETEGK